MEGFLQELLGDSITMNVGQHADLNILYNDTLISVIDLWTTEVFYLE